MIFENKWRPWRNMKALMLVAFMLPMLIHAGNVYAVSGSQEPVPFQNFYSGVGSARYDDYAKKEGVKVKDTAEFEKMKAHVVSTYEGVRIKNSFMLGDDYIDCVDVNTQPSLRQNGKFIALAKPPTPMIAREKPAGKSQQSQPVEPMLSKEKKDVHGNVQYCEEGFIPMRRITLDGLVRYETLSDFFNKYGSAGEKGLPLPIRK
ncbi:MAG: hypothetical protein M0Q44_07195 [Methylobacter sp.]|nr:hypothetical protein [Methylobacter sp.]